MGIQKVILPDSYSFAYSDIHPEEVNELRRRYGWSPDTAERWRECLDSSIVVGVRFDSKLVYDLRERKVCDTSIYTSRALSNSTKNTLNADLEIREAASFVTIPYQANYNSI